MLSWVLQLTDRLSPAARAAAASLATVRSNAVAASQAVTAAARAATSATAAFASSARASAPVTRLAAATQGLGRAAAAAARAVATLRGGAQGTGGGAEAAASGWWKLVAALGAAKLAYEGLRIAGAGVTDFLDAQTFKENILTSFGVLEGSAQGAGALLDRADVVARALGQKTSKIGEAFLELRAGGFDQKTTEAIVSGLGDLKAFNPKAQIDTISMQLTQLMGAGKITEEDMKPIRNAGLDDSIYYQVLREMTGISDQKALKKKLSSATGISSDIGLSAILETIRRQTNEDTLGQFANQRARTTVGGAVDNLKAMWERLLIYVNGSPLGASIARIANQLAGMLDPSTESGGRFVRMLDRAVYFAGILVDDLLNGGAISQGIDKALAFADAIGRIASPLITGFIDGLGEGFNVISNALDKLNPMLFGGSIEWEKWGRVLGYVVVGVLALPLALIWLGAVVFRTFQALGEALGGLYDLGANFVQGFWQGIKDQWAIMLNGFHALVELLPAGVRKVLGIASPSRVMMQLGGFTGEGFRLGIEAQLGALEGTAGRMRGAVAGGFDARGPLGTLRPGVPVVGTTGGGGVTVIVNGGLHAHLPPTSDPAAVDTGAIAAEAASLLGRELYDQLVSRGGLAPRESLEGT